MKIIEPIFSTKSLTENSGYIIQPLYWQRNVTRANNSVLFKALRGS